MKMAAFWDVKPCSLVDITDISEVLTAITLMMEAVSSSETSVSIYHTTQCNIPEDSHIKICMVLMFLPNKFIASKIHNFYLKHFTFCSARHSIPTAIGYGSTVLS
jgi:hypothetical protein